MAYVAFILASLVLFFGFLLLTRAEEHRGVRVLEKRRAALDRETERVAAFMHRTDMAGALYDGVRALSARMVHDITHAALLIVRFIERLLTRAIRTLRERRAHALPTRGASPFLSAISGFKKELRGGASDKEAKE